MAPPFPGHTRWMAYHLLMSKRPGDGLQRCAAEQLLGARDVLTAAATTDDRAARVEAVHSARKAVKKTRALARLARPALGEKRYRKVNDALREAGGTLSAARDADVMVAVVDGLRATGAGQLPAAAFDHLRSAAQATADGAISDPIPDAIDRLDAIAVRISGWDLDAMTWPTVTDTITRSYARGYAELATVGTDPTADARHELRKCVKDRWYQERLIQGAWQPLLCIEAEEAHVLSEYLGDDHDLAVLRDAITDGRLDAPIDMDGVLDLIDDRREDLLHDALLLGRRLYAERPKAFRRRLRTYVRVWQAAQQDEPVEV